MHCEDDYSLFAEKLFIIGVYGSKEETPDFTGCFEKWFEGTPFRHHVLGVERHPYRQTMKDSILDVTAVRTILSEFV